MRAWMMFDVEAGPLEQSAENCEAERCEQHGADAEPQCMVGHGSHSPEA